MFYYQLGDKQWTKRCFYIDIVRDLAMKGKAPLEESKTIFEDPVYCNGRLYAGMSIWYGYIIVVTEKLQPNDFSINCTSDPMAKYKPRLPDICETEEAISRLIGSNNKLKGGRIYIALKNCNYVYIYNIEEKSIVTSPPFSNLPENLYYSRWFMPDTRMTDTLKEEIGKSHQIREKESICNVVYLKDVGDIAHTKSPLPLDVVEVIAKNINDVLDYLQFRASNKLLRLAAPQIQWRSSSSMSMSMFDDLSMCPLFVFSEKDKVFTFVHPKLGLDYENIISYPQGEPWSWNCEICCSKDGWLLLVAVNNTKFQVFFNPFTKEVFRLPLLHKGIWNIRCFGMSDSSTSSKCVIVELVKGLSTITTAYINFMNRDYRHFTFESTKFPHYNVSPVFHNGLFYFLSKSGKLAVIEATGENIRWIVLEELQAPCSTCFKNFLVECDGNLLSVFESPFAKRVQVFKLNESTMTCMKVKSLKNHMIFVGKVAFTMVK
ncbi:hypothetical protein P8452_16168 [Trifolium repens]|nr:hypothetical protein P8452_16168 [Trifolium repens]